ncbi:MAG: ATP-binding protein [Streptosporangiaceae bacterium]
MTSTAVETNVMVAFVLLSHPDQVGMARCLVRTVLEYRGLGHYAPDAATIASELVTNAIQHAASGADPADKIGVTVTCVQEGRAVGIAVTDSSPKPPVKRDTTTGSERGRGLQIVEALSANWGWSQEQGGKSVYAILAKEG